MTAPSLFADWCVDSAPPWLQGPFGSAWLESFGIVADALHEGIRQGVKARFPGLAPIGGHDLLGAERNMVRAEVVPPYETDAAYGERLRCAWDYWQNLGGKPGLSQLFPLLGLTNVEVHDRKTMVVERRRDVWIIVKQPHPWTSSKLVGSGWSVGDGTVIGIQGMTVRQVKSLRNVLKPFVPMHSRCFMKIVFDTLTVGGGWSVGDGSVVGGHSARLVIKG